ncbi:MULTISPECIES: hypothetical protein [Streptomyces]|uniref:Uncharacterized protein n=1 Tax=Streptomyces thermoviolaceus subsp. thermoviolaceus TaxID=66860 RepID=A0ABX0YUA6_STRTL|nr:hypothetical protein [Streptomyces thermoviolaceus]NJP14663.1 hypothetical protein [Streptomyces thermoviolaceus subsp. thermoviolaceus]WTD51100.1 hypothetical protein OG899_09800 [Streptomyces thermoviolaceus]GHA93481.1 hypothetical protein GCM10010512_26180 [Streptomyces thermoviolaceus subsp. thermoviolaceus]
MVGLGGEPLGMGPALRTVALLVLAATVWVVAGFTDRRAPRVVASCGDHARVRSGR